MKNNRKRNNKKKYIIIISVAIIILLITTFICYKIFLLNKYDVNILETTSYDQFLNAYNKKSSVVVNYTEVAESEYLKYKNIKIKNVYRDYVKEDNSNEFIDTIIYKKKDASGNTVDALRISISETYTELFEADEKNFMLSIDSDGSSVPLEADIDDYLEDNHIKTDIELFKLLNETRTYNPNIFTSTKKIKGNYGTHLMASIVLPAIDKFTSITGEHVGYILSTNNYKEVSIIGDDDKRYVFIFTNKTDEEILDILNTLVIE